MIIFYINHTPSLPCNIKHVLEMDISYSYFSSIYHTVSSNQGDNKQLDKCKQLVRLSLALLFVNICNKCSFMNSM